MGIIVIACFIIWALVLFNIPSIGRCMHEQQCHRDFQKSWKEAKKEEKFYKEYYIKEYPPKDEYDEALNNPMVKNCLIPLEFELFFVRKRRERAGLPCIGDIHENKA